MDSDNLYIGSFLSAIFIIAALWHIRDNSRLEKNLKKKMDDQTAQWLVRFAWSRTLQLLAALGGCIVIFMNYDKQLVESRANFDTLSVVMEKNEKLEQQQHAQNAAAQPQPKPAPAAAASPPAAPAPAAIARAAAPAAAQAPQPLINPQNQVAQAAQPAPAKPAAPPQAAPGNTPAVQQQAAPPPATAAANAGQNATAAPVIPVQAVTQVPAANIRVTPPAAAQPAAPARNLQAMEANIAGGPDNDPAAAEDTGDADPEALAAGEATQAGTQGGSEEDIGDLAGGDEELHIDRNTKNETIEALYDPERSQSDRQSSLDDIKKRYEDILVIHMFLKKCHKIRPNDYKTINYAMTQEISAAGASQALKNAINASAKGSYREMYSRTPCNSKGIKDLTDQYYSYINVLSQNFRSQ